MVGKVNVFRMVISLLILLMAQGGTYYLNFSQYKLFTMRDVTESKGDVC